LCTNDRREALQAPHRVLFDRSIADENPFHTNEERYVCYASTECTTNNIGLSLSLSRQYRAPLVEAVRTAFTNYNLWIRKLAKKFVAIPRTQYAQRDEMKQSVLQIIADNHQDLVADMIETQYFAHYVDSRRT
jgi:hypothetical protein